MEAYGKMYEWGACYWRIGENNHVSMYLRGNQEIGNMLVYCNKYRISEAEFV